jgi:Holliday junction resolvase RusA-like endonuclease
MSSDVVLDLPVPPSVNRSRRVNWGKNGYAKVTAWHQTSDGLLLAARYKPRRVDRFELHVTFSETHTRADLDNGLKSLIDYLRRIEAIVDDGPQHLRKLAVEWGDAPEGCRVRIVPLTA